jgi:hypothetical protein
MLVSVKKEYSRGSILICELKVLIWSIISAWHAFFVHLQNCCNHETGVTVVKGKLGISLYYQNFVKMPTFSIYTELICFFDTVSFFQSTSFIKIWKASSSYSWGRFKFTCFFMNALPTFASHRKKANVIGFEDYCTHSGETLFLIILPGNVLFQKRMNVCKVCILSMLHEVASIYL